MIHKLEFAHIVCPLSLIPKVYVLYICSSCCLQTPIIYLHNTWRTWIIMLRTEAGASHSPATFGLSVWALGEVTLAELSLCWGGSSHHRYNVSSKIPDCAGLCLSSLLANRYSLCSSVHLQQQPSYHSYGVWWCRMLKKQDFVLTWLNSYEFILTPWLCLGLLSTFLWVMSESPNGLLVLFCLNILLNLFSFFWTPTSGAVTRIKVRRLTPRYTTGRKNQFPKSSYKKKADICWCFCSPCTQHSTP